ncbi:uncharacterized protein AAGF69_012548 [Amazona ochrocephala]
MAISASLNASTSLILVVWQGRCSEAEEAATSTRFMELRATAAWRPHRAWPVPTNVSFAGGYKLIGSHSGVKLCRWTKSMLRGRGGCYKHTFYGIESHCCMEATPSLACANQCVFCWSRDLIHC